MEKINKLEQQLKDLLESKKKELEDNKLRDPEGKFPGLTAFVRGEIGALTLTLNYIREIKKD